MISKMIAEKQKSQRLLHEVSLNDFASFGVLSWIVMAAETCQKKVKRTRRVFNQGRNLRIDSLPPHDAHASAPVLINIKAIDLDIRRDGSGQSGKRRVEPKCGRHQINQG